MFTVRLIEGPYFKFLGRGAFQFVSKEGASRFVTESEAQSNTNALGLHDRDIEIEALVEGKSLQQPRSSVSH